MAVQEVRTDGAAPGVRAVLARTFTRALQYGSICGAVLGAVVGLIIGIFAYLPTCAVALVEGAVLGATAGTVVGLAVACVAAIAVLVRQR